MPSISEALCREMRGSFQQLFRKLRPRRRLRDIELAEESGHGWSERQGSWCEGLRRRLSQALRREQLAGVQAGNRRVQHVETNRREKVGRYEEAERRDRHCATNAEHMVTFALPTPNAIVRTFFAKSEASWTKSGDM